MIISRARFLFPRVFVFECFECEDRPEKAPERERLMSGFSVNRLKFVGLAVLLVLLSAWPAGPASAQKSPPERAVKTAGEAAVAGPADTAGAVLGLLGLPGLSGAAETEESAYDRAARMRTPQRLTYGQRYRRNPDGSYGPQSSSPWNSDNLGQRLLEQALSAGSGYFSSWAEGWLGGYGKARLSLRVNDEGEVTGAGDFLYPIHDSGNMTFFTQLGLRTMANDRVIANFGLGQRFFPAEIWLWAITSFWIRIFHVTTPGAGPAWRPGMTGCDCRPTITRP
jgi:hypothetical protein